MAKKRTRKRARSSLTQTQVEAIKAARPPVGASAEKMTAYRRLVLKASMKADRES